MAIEFVLNAQRALRALQAIEHGKRVRALTTYRPGDVVAVSPMWGVHVASGIPARVERIDLDHDHVRRYEHDVKCYDAARVELSLAWGARPDGGAALRTREAQKRVCSVRFNEES